jgi:Ala-tRNA(Pro) deacylase
VHERIGVGRVSFGSASFSRRSSRQAPRRYPFGAINDTAGRVTVVLDAVMMAHARLNFHPLVNTDDRHREPRSRRVPSAHR